MSSSLTSTSAPSQIERAEGPVKKQTNIQMYNDNCDQRCANHNHAAICKVIVGHALPFTIINSAFFINMVTVLGAVYATKRRPKTEVF